MQREMLDSAIVIITIFGTIIGIIVAIIKILSIQKSPHIFFPYFKHSEITFSNGKNEEKISLMIAPIGNRRRRFFGDVAKKISVMLIYEAPDEKGAFSHLGNLSLPWVSNSYRPKIVTENPLNSSIDIQKTLEKNLFHWKERDIPQGRGENVIVAYGIEKTNKIFFATKPALEIILPKDREKKKGLVCIMARLRLEIAGENLPSTLSNFTCILASNWNDMNYPEKITLVKTPNKLRNFLLRLGFRKDVKLLGEGTK